MYQFIYALAIYRETTQGDLNLSRQIPYIWESGVGKLLVSWGDGVWKVAVWGWVMCSVSHLQAPAITYYIQSRVHTVFDPPDLKNWHRSSPNHFLDACIILFSSHQSSLSRIILYIYFHIYFMSPCAQKPVQWAWGTYWFQSMLCV
jgi:hypothetical protein